MLKKKYLTSWVVDSRGLDYMTRCMKIFTNFRARHENLRAIIADESDSNLEGTGSVKISKDITLNSVLRVPQLNYKILSITKLARDLNYIIKFFSNFCDFLFLNSRKMIDSAKLCLGLYLLEVNNSTKRKDHTLNSLVYINQTLGFVFHCNEDIAIMLCH